MQLLDHIIPIIYFLLALFAILIIYVWIKLEKTTDFTIINKTFYKYEEKMKLDENQHVNVKLCCPQCDATFKDFDEAAQHIVEKHSITQTEQWDYFAEQYTKAIRHAYIRGVCIGIIMSILYNIGRSLI